MECVCKKWKMETGGAHGLSQLKNVKQKTKDMIKAEFGETFVQLQNIQDARIAEQCRLWCAIVGKFPVGKENGK